jgi:hypothetical protein
MRWSALPSMRWIEAIDSAEPFRGLRGGRGLGTDGGRRRAGKIGTSDKGPQRHVLHWGRDALVAFSIARRAWRRRSSFTQISPLNYRLSPPNPLHRKIPGAADLGFETFADFGNLEPETLSCRTRLPTLSPSFSTASDTPSEMRSSLSAPSRTPRGCRTSRPRKTTSGSNSWGRGPSTDPDRGALRTFPQRA